MDPKPKYFNLNPVDEEGRVMEFPLQQSEYLTLKACMEDLINDANVLQLFPTSVPRLATISQSVYN